MALLCKIFIVFACTMAVVSCTLSAARDLIQFNIAGHPVLHQTTEWKFDPNIGARRTRQYQALNGPLGEKLIERLGLGIDGYHEERLVAQLERDAGHLGGVGYLTL